MARKSFADFMDSFLTDRRKQVSLLLIFLFSSFLILGFIYALSLIFGIKPTQLEISREGTLVYFQNETSKNFVKIVHPRGWQNSHIEIKKNDRMKFNLKPASNDLQCWLKLLKTN